MSILFVDCGICTAILLYFIFYFKKNSRRITISLFSIFISIHLRISSFPELFNMNVQTWSLAFVTELPIETIMCKCENTLDSSCDTNYFILLFFSCEYITFENANTIFNSPTTFDPIRIVFWQIFFFTLIICACWLMYPVILRSLFIEFVFSDIYLILLFLLFGHFCQLVNGLSYLSMFIWSFVREYTGFLLLNLTSFVVD